MPEIQVSYSEIFDKYSILELKSKYIKDESKLIEINKEKDILYKHIKTHLENPNIKYQYDILYLINKNIWDCLDTVHNPKISKGEKYEKALYINEDINDRRFRVKRKLDNMTSSDINEKKSYAHKKAILFCHSGFGDYITMNGAVRWLSTVYDELLVYCSDDKLQMVSSLFKDDTSIDFAHSELQVVTPFYNANGIKILAQFMEQGFEILLCGFHAIGFTRYDGVGAKFWLDFYSDLKIPYETRFDYTYFPRDVKKEMEIFETLNLPKDYIFTHDDPTRNFTLHSDYLDNICEEIYVYHPNRDFYKDKPESKFFGKWKNVRVNITESATLLQNAKEIHIMDSSFHCFCASIPLPNVKLVLYPRGTCYGEYTYDETFHRPDQKWEIIEKCIR